MAAGFGGLLQRDLALREPGADRLHLRGVLVPRLAGEHDTSGDEDRRVVVLAGQRHHHRRQALVAGGHAHHAGAGRVAAHQPAHHLRRVVAVRQAVVHPGGALCPAVARVGDRAGEWHAPQPGKLLRGRLHEQPDLPVPGVEAERDRRAVLGPQPAVGAEDEELLAAEPVGVPAHADVLRPAEQVAAGGMAQQLGGQRQLAGRAGRGRDEVVDGGVGRLDELGEHMHLWRAGGVSPPRYGSGSGCSTASRGAHAPRSPLSRITNILSPPAPSGGFAAMTRALPALLLAAAVGVSGGSRPPLAEAQAPKDPPKKARTGPSFEETPYGELPPAKGVKGPTRRVTLYTLTNRNGVTVKATDYGGIITEIHVPDKDGKFAD